VTAPPRITWLGTGNFEVPPGRFWNSFVVEGGGLTILVEPSPTSLPHYRRAGFTAEQLDVVLISHFHPDHTFGWPFLLFEMLNKRGGGGGGAARPLTVVGPPGVAAFLEQMMHLCAMQGAHAQAHDRLEIRYVEASDGSRHQLADAVSVSAVEVEHVPVLTCLGYVLDLDGVTLGYSGDSRPCPGLEVIAGRCSTFVIECNGTHPNPEKGHMDTGAVREMAARHPAVRFAVTHVGEDVVAGELPGIVLPDDFTTLELVPGQPPPS
jgi:ribonuclease Z